MGYPTHRAGWYTPHWLDELMWGERPRSADEIRPELQDLKVGDMVPDSDDWSAKSRGHRDRTAEPPGPALDLARLRAGQGSGLQLGVRAAGREGAAHTRLYVRARVAYRPRWILPFVESVVGLGDWVNASVMLRGIKRRAEGAPAE